MNALFKENSSSLLLMKIAFLTGCVSYRGMRMLTDRYDKEGRPDSRKYRESAAILKREGYFTDAYYRTSESGRSRLLIPTRKAVDELGGTLFPDDVNYVTLWKHWLGYKNIHKSSIEKTIVTRVERVISSSEQCCFFYRVFDYQDDVVLAKLRTGLLPGDKDTVDNDEWGQCSWYLTREIRMTLDKEVARKCVGRAQGYIRCQNNVFACIGMKRYPIVLRGESENLTLQIAKSTLLKHPDKGRCDYLITGDPQLLWYLVQSGADLNRKGKYRFYIDTDLSIDALHYYLVPYSHDGAKVAALLMTKSGPEILRMLPASGRIKKGSMKFLYDYKQDDSYVLSFLVPDLYKLKKFIRALSVYRNEKGIIYLYDFQEESVRMLTKGMKNISIVAFYVSDVVDAFKEVIRQDDKKYRG